MRRLYLSIPTVNVNCCSPSRMQSPAKKLCLHQGPLDVPRAKISYGLGMVRQAGHLLRARASDRGISGLWGSLVVGDMSSWGPGPLREGPQDFGGHSQMGLFGWLGARALGVTRALDMLQGALEENFKTSLRVKFSFSAKQKLPETMGVQRRPYLILQR